MKNAMREQRTENIEQIKPNELTMPSALCPLPCEKGFVSIFSVLIIMAILTLIAVGFSTITRRAQQRVLNNQLNTQAYYAAESAVNDAIRAVKADPNLTKTSCQAVNDGFSYNNNLDSTLNVGYTCILINNIDSKLVYSGVPLEGTANAETTDLKLTTGQPLKTFDVTWSAHTNSSSTIIPSGSTLWPLQTWTNNYYPGLVRIDLIPTDQGLDRDSLAKKGYSFYLYASQTASSANASVNNMPSDQGGLVLVRCTTSPCTVHITLGNAVATSYKMRLQSVYDPVDVTLSNGADTSGTAGNWIGGQITIDATGKANDVLRRIQVRIPVTSNGLTPSFGLQTADSICKRLAVMPSASGGTTTDSTDDACLAN